ncbi:MAG: hypothetical protein ACO3EH_00400 [Ilumatobacteraceae bacterium]
MGIRGEHREEPEQTGAEQLHMEVLVAINRFRDESDITICEVLGVLRLVEEDVIRSTRS